MTTVLFVLGPPGAGKTTLVREMLGEHRILTPCPVKITLGEDAIAAGHYTGNTFDGADTVPYSGARGWLEYWYENVLDKLPESELTILDGDRFSHAGTLEYLRDIEGVRVVGVYLDVSAELLAERRAKRGSNQNATWMKGRETKARNFAAKIDAAIIDANTCDTFAVLDDVYKHIDKDIFR